MKIERTRYVVMRKDRTEIWCGYSRRYNFKSIDEIGGTEIKTYTSKEQAKSSCSSWDRNFEVVKIKQILEMIDDLNEN